MAKYAICDNCGARDDWGGPNGVPVLDGGLVIQVRTENGANEIEREFELCPSCREQLFKAFPNLLSEPPKSAKSAVKPHPPVARAASTCNS